MQSDSETLDGIVERIKFASEDTGYTVALLAVEGRRELVTVVGNLLGVQPGESLRLRGSFSVDKKYGEQFRASHFLPVKPATIAGLERYLGSGLVPGIGRAMAARLVAHFQLDTLHVLEHQPERLTEVEGIGPVRKERIKSAWLEQRGIQDVMVFLQSHGISPAYAVRIYKLYGQRAISVVRQNPYQLAFDVHGIGFKSADRIAQELGIRRDSPRRAEAGVLHVASEFAEAGHCYVPRALLIEQSSAMLDVDTALVETAIDTLAQSEHLVVAPIGDSSTGNRGVYLTSLYRAETACAARLAVLIDTPPLPLRVDTPRALSWFEQQTQIALAVEQRQAIERAMFAKVIVITGGPGTGKTTIINGILRILEKKDRRIILCAPTGRAAKRMQQATAHEARTAHRLLEFSPKNQGFGRDHSNPLECDTLIVDEASMVDVVLLAHLLDALPDQAQLILVGDIDQLPSVGPGSVLRDIIAAATPPPPGVRDRLAVVRLTQIFRQARQSLIVVNAHRINAGQMPEEPAAREPDRQSAPADFYFVERETPDAVSQTVQKLVAERIPRSFGFHPIDDIQVLTPMQKSVLGVAQLNSALQARLNPPASGGSTARELMRGSRVFREGDKVMQIQNNYDRDVYNGDIGRILKVDPEERQLIVRFDDREVIYEASDLDELVHAYACSIHKSQGSEYPAVVIALHTQHYVMLQRNLLYTAVTRGKRLVVIVGNRKALGIAVRSETHELRYTHLAERIRERLQAEQQ